MLARAIQHETDHLDGILFIDRLDREARREAMKYIREAEWSGEARTAPQVKVSPARDLRAGALGAGSSAGRLRRHPERRPCLALDAVADSRHELVGVVTRPDAPSGRGRKLVASPVAQRAEELGVPVLSPATPARARLPGGAARARARLLPGRRLRRPGAAGGARHPAPTAGSTCTSRCCPSWRGAAPVQHAIWAGDEVTGATTFRLVRGARHRPDVRRDDRRPSARATPPATCSDRLAEGGAGPARRRPSTASRTAPSRRASSRPTGCQPRAQDHRRGRPRRLDRARGRRRPPGPRLHARRRVRGRPSRGERVKLGPVAPADREPAARRARGGPQRGARRHRDRRRCELGRVQAVRQAGDGRRRLGPWRAASPTAPMLGM